MKVGETAEAASGNIHGAYGAAALVAGKNSPGPEDWAKEVVGIGTVVGVVGRDLFAAFRIVVPVIQAILLVGVYVSFLFFPAAGYGESSDQHQSDMKSASSAHKSLRCQLK